MSVGLLLVTHDGVGTELSRVARVIYANAINSIANLSLPSDLQPEALGQYADQVREALQAQDRGDGVLVLTDAFGATPDNLARYFAKESNARVVSGINLPMLLRVLNYAQLSLEELCETAVDGGRRGVYLK